MNKRIIYSLFLFSIISCNFAFSSHKPLNVLFIAVDDMNTDLNCYGIKQVKTPNIDRLSAMGMRFNNAYCQQALCGPSRASIMTGLRPDTNGCTALGPKDHFRHTVPDAVTLGQYFQKKGYYVGRVGKIFHYGNPSMIGTDGEDDPPTWQERFNPAGIDKLQEENITRYGPNKKRRKGDLGISMAWWDPESKDEEHTDGMVATRAIEMIERNKNRPFFVAAGFFDPHCPYVAPKKYFDLYPLESIIMPDLEEAKKDLEDVPPMAISRDGGKHWPYYFPGVTVEEARKCKQAYYACISFVDAQVGRLLDALEKNTLMDNTLIVFWSDHGYFLGEKGLWYKRKNFERAVRAPMIIAGPTVKSRGKFCMQPVELLDLYPTIVDQAGYEIPGELEGCTLTPLLDNPEVEWNKPAISQVLYKEGRGYTIRTRKWRYIEWKQGAAGRELYDHENDPDEITNLAGNPEYADTIKELSEQLRPFTLKFYKQ